MDYSKAAIVVGIALLLVILFNLAIYSSFGRKRGNQSGTINMLQSAFKTARDPWKDEDNALKELAERVKSFTEDIEDQEGKSS